MPLLKYIITQSRYFLIFHKSMSMNRYTNKTLKVKNFSYSPLDQIGKGFSSIVYRGTNDETSKHILFMLRHDSIFIFFGLF